ncbi:MerR family transcriptional regulator [Kutzneria viridogrisea]|uniref:DNA-binding transcriptional MerR regulator n=1 Tax=Kutzneria viridogrisea TaxID=47990 RepID=A0ABR6BMQ9_9PSEU|nr:DNA-binding transcriptional MerR regulator [Kutzneria viridogrisea]
MPWSTRELAELAGTSLRTVRHYHDVGLLPEPERRANGYKSYGVGHLVRLLRIKRFADLGFSLAQITEMDDTDQTSDDALRELDAKLAADIERLQRARDEIGTLLRDKVAAMLPPELAAVPEGVEVSEAERSLLVVISQLLGPGGREPFAEWMRGYERTPEDIEFDALPADADEQTRADLAARMLPYSVQLREQHQGRLLRGEDVRGGPHYVQRTIGEALRDIYNPAQLDVLVRLSALLPDDTR